MISARMPQAKKDAGNLGLASTWRDFEDACLNQVAHKVKPDAIVTDNVKDFALSDFPVFDCNSLFDWIKQRDGISYCELALRNDTTP